MSLRHSVGAKLSREEPRRLLTSEVRKGFSGGITIAGGQPYPVVTCGHGTAYDIAGKNIVTTASFENAVKMASQMAVNNKKN